MMVRRFGCTNKIQRAIKGIPKFYYNLMFYFYAMPFILADDGIVYEDVKPLDIEGKSYPGIKISYESGSRRITRR